MSPTDTSERGGRVSLDTSRHPFWRHDLHEALRNCTTVYVTDGDALPVNVGWHLQPSAVIRKRLARFGIDVR